MLIYRKRHFIALASDRSQFNYENHFIRKSNTVKCLQLTVFIILEEFSQVFIIALIISHMFIAIRPLALVTNTWDCYAQRFFMLSNWRKKNTKNTKNTKNIWIWFWTLVLGLHTCFRRMFFVIKISAHEKSNILHFKSRHEWKSIGIFQWVNDKIFLGVHILTWNSWRKPETETQKEWRKNRCKHCALQTSWHS